MSHIIRYQTIIAATACALFNGSVYGKEIETLPTMEVLGDIGPNSLTSPSIEEARFELNRTPGGVSLIDSKEYRERATPGGIADVLSLSPGVFSQSRFGNQEARISIRGSGITQTFGVRGIRFLRDGLPLTNADGFTNPELIEPMTSRFIEVYRGANALQYGSATLGGAINFASRTGQDTNGYGVNMMFGSHDYYRPQVMLGGKLDNGLDVFGSFSGSYNGGFRDQGQEEISRGYANIGYKWNEDMETRVHLTAFFNDLELPGPLTLSQLKDDPNQANAFWKRRNAQRNLKTLRADFRHTMRFGNDQLDIGGWYENRELTHPLPFVFIESDSENSGASFRYLHNSPIAGFDNRIIAGGFFAWGDAQGTNSATLEGGSKGAFRQNTFDESYTVEGYLEDHFSLTSNLDLIAGTQFVYAKRQGGTDPGNSLTQHYAGFSPKAGVVWNAWEDIQFFGNVSRSYEPPTTIEFNPAGGTGPGPLNAQEATTLEIGSRGAWSIFNWELAAYHSWIKNEILQQEKTPGSGVSLTTNANETFHSGIEAGLGAVIPLGLIGDDSLNLRSVYTYNRFRFDDDSSFGDNQLAGIPEHFGTLEALYEHSSGFYIGPNVQMASRYFVDFANTVKTPAYTIMGARAGYSYNKTYSVFVEGRNLTNEKWVSNTGVQANLDGDDSSVFNPGIDRTIFAGFSVDMY
ncbi:MAG: TonB-dependent receptor [Methylomicrobium sp.]|nr:TonB-dependent receptor [Methylomicrobium sp.]